MEILLLHPSRIQTTARAVLMLPLPSTHILAYSSHFIQLVLPDALLDLVLLDHFNSLFLFGFFDSYIALILPIRARICISNSLLLFSLVLELLLKK